MENGGLVTQATLDAQVAALETGIVNVDSQMTGLITGEDRRLEVAIKCSC